MLNTSERVCTRTSHKIFHWGCCARENWDYWLAAVAKKLPFSRDSFLDKIFKFWCSQELTSLFLHPKRLREALLPQPIVPVCPLKAPAPHCVGASMEPPWEALASVEDREMRQWSGQTAAHMLSEAHTDLNLLHPHPIEAGFHQRKSRGQAGEHPMACLPQEDQKTWPSEGTTKPADVTAGTQLSDSLSKLSHSIP